MKYQFGKKVLNIPDAEIEQSMKSLDISKEEAIQMWLDDNDYTSNEEQEELDKKAAKAHVNKNARGEKKESKPRPPRKPNDEKRAIIDSLMGWAASLTWLDSFANPNPEREITFTIGNNDYSITLTQHRKKKA